MPLEEIVALLRAKPFVPFRVHLLDGASYDVRHPEWLVPMTRSVLIGQNPDPKVPYIESGNYVVSSLRSVSRLEPLTQAVSKDDGQTA